MLNLSPVVWSWYYKPWQRRLAGYMRAFAKNYQPNNNLVGFVINDKHPKSVRVQCERWHYSVRYKKAFRTCRRVWAHDENNSCRLGDVVKVQPLGYRMGPWKNYVLVEILYREPRDVENMTTTSPAQDDELSDLDDNDNLTDKAAKPGFATSACQEGFYWQKDYQNDKKSFLIPFLKRNPPNM